MAALDGLLERLAELPPALLYIFIAVGAAVENIAPPIPADTFVLLGAFLAGFGRASPILVFFWCLIGNIASAFAMYHLSGKYGPRFFRTRVGRLILQPGQLEQISRFYFRWGAPAIFLSRFLPGLRAVVPLFAGVSAVPPLRLLGPLIAASALWYGTLVSLGAAAGRNWDVLAAAVDRVGGTLLIAALVIVAAIGVWWIRSRRRRA